jgi:hypothetical protein
VLIGNFYDDTKTDTGSIAGPYSGSETAYYYIDDVCVTTDSIYNMNYAIGIKENGANSLFGVYPNPALNDLFITGQAAKIYDVIIYNELGMKVMEFSHIGNRIDVSNLSEGLYSVHLNSDGVSETKRVVIRR